jgi:hypothetical protein
MIVEIKKQTAKKTKENVGHTILKGILEKFNCKRSSPKTRMHAPSGLRKVRRLEKLQPDRSTAVNRKAGRQSQNHIDRMRSRKLERYHAERRKICAADLSSCRCFS